MNVLPRSDGIAVQSVSGEDMRGYQDESLIPDRQEPDAAVQTVAAVYSKFRRMER